MAGHCRTNASRICAVAALALLGARDALAGPPYVVNDIVTAPLAISDLEVDGAGNAYVAGTLSGYAFPGVDSAKILNAGAGLRIVARFPPAGKTPAWVAVVGAPTPANPTGAGATSGLGLDAGGNAYLAAYDASALRDYPQVGGVFDPAIGARHLYRVSATGAITRLGALDPAIRTVAAIAVDRAGGIYVTGSARDGLRTSSGAPYGADAVASGCIAPFVTKLAADGQQVAYATYLGFAGTRGYDCTPPVSGAMTPDAVHPTGFALAIDALGSAYVAGQASAGAVATPGAVDLGTKVAGPYAGNKLVLDNASHAFVTRLDPAGTRIVFSARIGGSLRDRATSVRVTPEGNVLLAGKTSSPDFPRRGLYAFSTFVHMECLLWTPEFGFLTELTPEGSAILLSGVLPMDGGELDDCGSRYASSGFNPAKATFDAAGNIVVAGATTQSNRQLDTTDGAVMPDVPASASASGGQLLAVFDAQGRRLYTSALPQAGVLGIAVDRWRNVVVAGANSITRLGEGRLPVDLSFAPQPLCAGTPAVITARAAGANDSGTIDFFVDGIAVGSVAVADSSATRAVDLAAGVRRVKAIYRGPGPYDGYASLDLRVGVEQQGACP